MSSRPEIPADLARQLMMEAGHRCAIPTCRAVSPLQIEHINDWSRVRKHEFSNMIVLCANCHGRKGSRRGEIDRKSLRQYKANLAIINNRYGEFERRVLDYFAKTRPHWIALEDTLSRYDVIRQQARALAAAPTSSELSDRDKEELEGYIRLDFGSEIEKLRQNRPESIEVARGFSFLLNYLVKDGYIRISDDPDDGVTIDGRKIVYVYKLTDAGLRFVEKWESAQPLDDVTPLA